MPRCAHLAALLFASVLALLAVITPAAAHQDQPASRVNPHAKPITNRPVVLIQTTNTDDSHSSIIGVFIAPGEVLIGAAAIDEARSATAILPTCEKFEVEGILAIDETPTSPSCRSAHPASRPPSPPSPRSSADRRLRRRRCRHPHAGCWGMLAHTKPLPILSTRKWAASANASASRCRRQSRHLGLPHLRRRQQPLRPGLLRRRQQEVLRHPRHQVPPPRPRGGRTDPLAKHAERPATDRMKASRLAAKSRNSSKTKSTRRLSLSRADPQGLPDDWQALYERGVCLDVTGKPKEASPTSAAPPRSNRLRRILVQPRPGARQGR
jgi:hypothetical protein